MDVIERDVEYTAGGARMIGSFCRPAPPPASAALPGLVLVHDAFGLTDGMRETARRYARLGFAVLAADVWGERTQPATEAGIGPLIGSMVGDRDRWNERIDAARTALLAQPDVDPERIAMVGYCFGGSSVLEYARRGGDVRGVVSVHGGLDLLDPHWSTPTGAKVLLCTGSDDPMATPEMLAALQRSMSDRGVQWEADVYSGTKHAFTNPRADEGGPSAVIGYNAVSSARAWAATARFLDEVLVAAPVP